MYKELVDKAKRIKPSALSDADIEGFFEEAETKLCEGLSDYSSGAYMDDALLYYALAQIALYSGDTADYSNYYALYDNAAVTFRRDAFSKEKPKGMQYQNIW